MSDLPALAAFALGLVDLLIAIALPPKWVGPLAWFPVRRRKPVALEHGALLSNELRASVLAQSIEPIRARKPFCVDVRFTASKLPLLVRFRVSPVAGGMEMSARGWPAMVFAPLLFMAGGWFNAMADSTAADHPRSGVAPLVFMALVSLAFLLATRRFRDHVDAVEVQLLEIFRNVESALAAEAIARRPKHLPHAPPPPETHRF